MVLLAGCAPPPGGSEFFAADSGATDAGEETGIAPSPDAAPPPQPPPPTPPPPAPICSIAGGTDADARALVASDTAFALAFYGPAAGKAGAGQNVVLSPYSVSATLTMLDVGAASETDTQIRTVLSLPGNGATVAPSYASVACTDETDGAWTGDQLSIANAVWGQQSMAFVPAFTSTLSSGFDAPLHTVDFASDPAAAASTINAWVSGQTAGLIPSLFGPGDLDAKTVLVLVDALYFKGTWQNGFSTALTQPRSFTLSDDTQVQVPTMTGIVSLGIGTVKTASLAVYELPYMGGALAMDFLVPQSSLASLESALTPALLAEAIASLEPSQQAQLYLPKFSFGTRLGLNDVLAGMGMPDAFDSATANFSGMDGHTDIFVQTVVHQAFVEVDEEGTVAAAATGDSNGSALFSPSTIAIASPFLFLIRDTHNGSLLFMGRVEDPRGS